MSSLDIGPSTSYGITDWVGKTWRLIDDWSASKAVVVISYKIWRAPWHRDMIDVLISCHLLSHPKNSRRLFWWPRHWIAVVPKIVEQHVVAQGSKNESNKLLSKLVAIRLETCRLLVATRRYQKHLETSNLEVDFIIFYQPTWSVKSH